MKKDSFILQWTFRGTTELIKKVTGFLVVAAAARLTDQGLFGTYIFLLTSTNVFALPVDFGLNVMVTRQSAREKEPAGEILSGTFTIRLCLSLIALIAAAAASSAGFFHDLPLVPVYIFLIFWILNVNADTPPAFLEGRRLFGLQTLIVAAGRTALPVAALIALMTEAGILGLGAAYVLSALLTLAAGLFIVQKKFTPAWGLPPLKNLRLKFKQSAPVAIMLFFAFLYFKIDILMITWLRGEVETAHYGAAFKILELMMVIPATFTAVVFPRLSKMHSAAPENIKREFFKYEAIAAILAGVCFVVFYAGAPILLSAIFGQEFAARETITVMRILAGALAVIFLNYPAIYLIISHGKQSANAVNAALCFIFNLLANAAVIPFYGMKGAAVTTILTEALLGFLSLREIMRLETFGSRK